MSPDRDANNAVTPGVAAKRLFGFLHQSFWTGSVLEGPDPGIRFNTRVGRFVKSYAPMISWKDNLVYQQAQGYWIVANWMLWRSTGDPRHRKIAVSASDSVLTRQRSEGYWQYPNPEWRGRIATVEGCFGALGLLESYEETGEEQYLEAAIRWHRFMESEVGYRNQPDPSMLAVNYFRHASDHGGGVPNNTTLALWLLARLWEATEDAAFLERASSMVNWLTYAQRPDGELPYRLAPRPEDHEIHFLCHQYNAFEFMDLVNYRRITGDESICTVIERLAGFLATGVTDDLQAAFDCGDHRTNVLYYDLALAQALMQATELGLGTHKLTVDAMYHRVISQQRPDGAFQYHSRRNYGFLRDTRPYPRYLAMMLVHLLLGEAQGVTP